MAKSKNISEQSVIVILSSKRGEIFCRADADGRRSLTEAEALTADLALSLMASANATGRGDAAMQVAAAREIVELVLDGHSEPVRLREAHAALASASRALAA